MARSIRLLYRNLKGRSRHNYNWPPIHKGSAVIVTAAEWKQTGRDPAGDWTGRPHLGEATVHVTNIGPHDPEGGAGGVEFFLHVDWHEPLTVQVTISVLDPVEEVRVVE